MSRTTDNNVSAMPLSSVRGLGRWLWFSSRGGIGPFLALLILPRLGDAINLLYSVMTSRMLPEGQFGQALSITNALGVVSTAFGVIVCQESVRLTEAGQHDSLVRYAWRWFFAVLAVAVVAAAAIVLLGPYFGTIFRYASWTASVALALTTVVVIVRPVWAYVTIGQRQFYIIGAGQVFEAVLKYGTTFVLLYIGWQLTGYLMAQFFSGIACLLLTIYLAVRAARRGAAAEPEVNHHTLPAKGHMLLASLVTSTAMTMMFNLDVMVVNFIFPGCHGDAFGAVSTLAKTAAYVPEALAVMLLPLVIRRQLLGESGKSILTATVVIALVASAALALGFAVFGVRLMHLYNPAFTSYAFLLPRYSIAVGVLCVGRLCATYAMSHGRVLPGVVFMAGCGLELFLCYLHRSTVAATVNIYVVCYVLVSIVCAALVLSRTGKTGACAGRTIQNTIGQA